MQAGRRRHSVKHVAAAVFVCKLTVVSSVTEMMWVEVVEEGGGVGIAWQVMERVVCNV